MNSCEDLHQGRLAGAVSPQQRMDLGALQLEIHVREHADAIERLVYGAHAQYRGRDAHRALASRTGAISTHSPFSADSAIASQIRVIW